MGEPPSPGARAERVGEGAGSGDWDARHDRRASGPVLQGRARRLAGPGTERPADLARVTYRRFAPRAGPGRLHPVDPGVPDERAWSPAAPHACSAVRALMLLLGQVRSGTGAHRLAGPGLGPSPGCSPHPVWGSVPSRVLRPVTSGCVLALKLLGEGSPAETTGRTTPHTGRPHTKAALPHPNQRRWSRPEAALKRPRGQAPRLVQWSFVAESRLPPKCESRAPRGVFRSAGA